MITELGKAADELARATHKALALGAVIHRDHQAGHASCNEPLDDLGLVERANNDVLNAAAAFTNLLWRIGHQLEDEDD